MLDAACDQLGKLVGLCVVERVLEMGEEPTAADAEYVCEYYLGIQTGCRYAGLLEPLRGRIHGATNRCGGHEVPHHGLKYGQHCHSYLLREKTLLRDTTISGSSLSAAGRHHNKPIVTRINFVAARTADNRLTHYRRLLRSNQAPAVRFLAFGLRARHEFTISLTGFRGPATLRCRPPAPAAARSDRRMTTHR